MDFGPFTFSKDLGAGEGSFLELLNIELLFFYTTSKNHPEPPPLSFLWLSLSTYVVALMCLSISSRELPLLLPKVNIKYDLPLTALYYNNLPLTPT